MLIFKLQITAVAVGLILFNGVGLVTAQPCRKDSNCKSIYIDPNLYGNLFFNLDTRCVVL